MFVRQGDKLINVGAAASIDIGPVNTRGKRPLTLRDARGDVLAVTNDDVLPAIENTEREAILIAGPVNAAFVDDDGSVSWAVIIGWRVHADSSIGSPVFAESPPHGHMFMMVQGGGLIGLGGKMFKNLAEATKAIQAAASLATLEVQ